MSDTPTFRQATAELTDIDMIQHDIAQRLGIVAADVSMADVKGLYWTANPIGDALAKFVFALVQAGVLEASAHDETVMRWNPAFDGWKPRRPAK